MATLLLLAGLFSIGSTESIAASTSYVVEGKDILGYISLKHYGTSRKWRQIARWNNLSNPHQIKPGQVLVLKEAPTLSLVEGARLVAAQRAKHRSIASYALRPPAPPEAPKPDVAAHQTPAKAANRAYAQGDYRSAGRLFTLERKQHPERVTPWLYELSALKLAGNLDDFLTVRQDFLKRFPSLSSLELLTAPSRKIAASPRR